MEKSWEPPRYKRVETLPFIPLESELDALIAGSSKRMSAFLQGLKETGANAGELWHLKWINIDKEHRVVTINAPYKGHRPRILPITPKFIAMVDKLPRRSEYVFMTTPKIPCNNFASQRKKVAHKLQNLRLLKITFRTFRHWKGTMEYHKTRDILHVMRVLGHRSLKNTGLHRSGKSSLQANQDNFTVQVANNVKEACELVEAGFEYVTGEYDDGGKIFRKRK